MVRRSLLLGMFGRCRQVDVCLGFAAVWLMAIPAWMVVVPWYDFEASLVSSAFNNVSSSQLSS